MTFPLVVQWTAKLILSNLPQLSPKYFFVISGYGPQNFFGVTNNLKALPYFGGDEKNDSNEF